MKELKDVQLMKSQLMKDLQKLGDRTRQIDSEITLTTSEDKGAPVGAEIKGKRRVALLRSDKRNSTPLPPLVVDTSQGQQAKLLLARRQNGYGGDALDAAHIGGWLRNDTNGYEPKLWDWLIETQHISSFIDVGCGAGLVTKHFHDRGVDALCVEASNEAINVGCGAGLVTKHFHDRGVDALCVEASNEAINLSFAPRDRIVQHDFTRGPWFPPGGRVVDVAYTVEFLEHVEEGYLDNVVSLLKSARYVIMSASSHGGWSHVNVHKPWWWIERMESYGFLYSLELTEILKRLTLNSSELQRGYPYLKFNGLVFRNPEVDSEQAFKEAGTMDKRKLLW
eukprot:CAMPEP_0196598450 /NCGR_PEP_ID=MMETSP1081-20130531/94328_1 /TAXON_ID=36882 /ORGANISM="Pyramimonas amylifera, Strain CCMP720" /LENGTH=336 /DNA_ID=CAMNT_0041924149 /DNA_START=473 /DNA_END=1481 /DNA_ORIENTATION=-